MSGCDLCGLHKGKTKGAVVQGKYGSYCKHCISGAKRMENVGHAKYNRDRDREDFRRDMLQPWQNGKPNRDFINNYPEESQNIFNEKELHENG